MPDVRNVYRKIASWREVIDEPTYHATFECGHEATEYDGVDAKGKAEMEARGELVCYKCTREEEELMRAERVVRELKEKRSRRPK